MYTYSLVRIPLHQTMTPTSALNSPAAATAARQVVTRVAVVGATGYAGQELMRLLARHPAASLTVATGSQATSTPRRLPGLAKIWEGDVRPLDLTAVSAGADVAFLALPEAASAEVGPALLEAGLRVIDLSGAFRLRDEAARTRWYPATSVVPADVAYGLTEFERAAIAEARLVANPGCYPMASLLALLPLKHAGLLADDTDIVIDAKSGISGAGKAPSERTHFSENHGSVAAYAAFGHRHTPEMEQALARGVTFVPHLVPLDRGLLASVYARLIPGADNAAVAAAFEQAYATAPFVRLTGGDLPEIKHVAWTNFCDIGWKVDEGTGRVVIVSVIDNLLKGAAGSAVQNFNTMLGLDEKAGLL
jgi:N-acetyl-gamma-glutamyl-phosphate reductase